MFKKSNMLCEETRRPMDASAAGGCIEKQGGKSTKKDAVWKIFNRH